MNRLGDETSPYLQQHADNPVDWFPWSQEALVIARDLDKPILLSIGYSACHWCHVMAHESFEDSATAELMNRLYVNIKVDREERPDLDRIYQAAHSMLNQRPGGWPLTVFLDPRDQMPIFAGTYFPKEPRQGLTSFLQMLVHINGVYRDRKDDIDQQSASIRLIFDKALAHPIDTDAVLNAMPLDIARNQIAQRFDTNSGGYSGAPKFPHVPILLQAMRHWYRSTDRGDLDTHLLRTAMFSIERMCEGGLFDHLGGGFFRYSTDERWMIPHFEKMLYDNGLLLSATTQAWCIDHRYIYKHAARETAQWAIREMQSPEGGFWSAIDADSEGEEGRYYTWRSGEIEQLIDGPGLQMLSARFGLDQPANFEGAWHLHAFTSEDELARRFDLDPAACHRGLYRLRDRLLQSREQRPRPDTDEKILTAWNALMITGLAQAGRHLQQPRYIESAIKAMVFITDHHLQGKQLMASSRNGEARLHAYLDDHAFLLQALMELLQCRWNKGWLELAIQLADAMLDGFEDRDNGGFFFTSHQHEKLIQRSKSFADEATASGNGIASLFLLRLGYLTGISDYLEAAEDSLRCAWRAMNDNAIAHASMLQALDELLTPTSIIILRGDQDELERWQSLAAGLYLPSTFILPVPSDADIAGFDFLENKRHEHGACAWVCEGTSCRPAISSIDEYLELLESMSGRMESLQASPEN